MKTKKLLVFQVTTPQLWRRLLSSRSDQSCRSNTGNKISSSSSPSAAAGGYMSFYPLTSLPQPSPLEVSKQVDAAAAAGVARSVGELKRLYPYLFVAPSLNFLGWNGSFKRCYLFGLEGFCCFLDLVAQKNKTSIVRKNEQPDERSEPPLQQIWCSRSAEEKSLIKKAVASSSPPAMFMIIRGDKEGSQLAFCKNGSDKWTHATRAPSAASYEDIVYFEKEQKFYALSKTDHLEAWDFSRSCDCSFPEVKTIHCGNCNFADFQSTLRFRDEYQTRLKKYLVDSLGELLLVVRYFIPNTNTTRCFDVFKLNFVTNKWVPMINSLEGRTLFVDVNDCISVAAADYPGLSEDSIYYAGTYETTGTEEEGGLEMGVYSLRRDKVEILYWDEFKEKQPHPIWIFPDHDHQQQRDQLPGEASGILA